MYATLLSAVFLETSVAFVRWQPAGRVFGRLIKIPVLPSATKSYMLAHVHLLSLVLENVPFCTDLRLLLFRLLKYRLEC